MVKILNNKIFKSGVIGLGIGILSTVATLGYSVGSEKTNIDNKFANNDLKFKAQDKRIDDGLVLLNSILTQLTSLANSLSQTNIDVQVTKAIVERIEEKVDR